MSPVGRVAPGAARGASGMAVPLVLFILVGLTGIAWGVLAVASAEGRAARSAAGQEAGRQLALGGLRLQADRLHGDSLPALPFWTPLHLDDSWAGEGEVVLALERIAREWHLLRVRARVDGREPWWRAARAVWSLDPVARVAHAPGVVTRGGGLLLEGGGEVDGALWDAPEGAPLASCVPYRLAIDSVLPGGRLPPERARPSGEGPRLGLLHREDLRERLAPMAGGVMVPGPVVDLGGCRAEEPTNWGSPREPDGPCGGVRRARWVEGDLELAGGEAQGLLAVEGALHLRGGALFAGVVVVRDSLALDEGSRIVGLAVVGGQVRVGGTSRVEGGGCAAALALAGAPRLRTPLVRAGTPLLRVR